MKVASKGHYLAAWKAGQMVDKKAGYSVAPTAHLSAAWMAAWMAELMVARLVEMTAEKLECLTAA